MSGPAGGQPPEGGADGLALAGLAALALLFVGLCALVGGGVGAATGHAFAPSAVNGAAAGAGVPVLAALAAIGLGYAALAALAAREAWRAARRALGPGLRAGLRSLDRAARYAFGREAPRW